MCMIDQMENGEDLRGEKGCYTSGFKHFSKISKNKIKKEQPLLKYFYSERKTETIWDFAVAEKVWL